MKPRATSMETDAREEPHDGAVCLAPIETGANRTAA
jgi:hypothetical protein